MGNHRYAAPLLLAHSSDDRSLTLSTRFRAPAGCGWISEKFLLDLVVDPATRDVKDIQHEVYAVASRSKDKAGAFVQKYFKEAGVEGADKVSLLPTCIIRPSLLCGLADRLSPKLQVKLYGSYEDLFADANVDCVYVGTPHSHHYQNVHAALSAGKNVLCEKAFTANAEQAKALVKLAREKDVFLMEAVWTRFQPFAYKLQEIIRSGAIGEVRSAQAELNVDFTETVSRIFVRYTPPMADRCVQSPLQAKADPKHRLVNPDLCGGSLLDLGPYPWYLSSSSPPPSQR